MTVIGDARPLEDDRLVAATLGAETREADVAAGGAALGEVLQRLAECLQSRLVGAVTTSPRHGASWSLTALPRNATHRLL